MERGSQNRAEYEHEAERLEYHEARLDAEQKNPEGPTWADHLFNELGLTRYQHLLRERRASEARMGKMRERNRGEALDLEKRHRELKERAQTALTELFEFERSELGMAPSEDKPESGDLKNEEPNED
jgi:hypothetical protein